MPATLLKISSFTGVFKNFDKIIAYHSLNVSNLRTATFKEHLSEAASLFCISYLF